MSREKVPTKEVKRRLNKKTICREILFYSSAFLDDLSDRHAMVVGQICVPYNYIKRYKITCPLFKNPVQPH